MFRCVRPWYIDNHLIFSKPATLNGFELSLPVAVCSGLANSWFQLNLGELNTKYGYQLSLPQTILLWTSQFFGSH